MGVHSAHRSRPVEYRKLDVQLIGACEPTVRSVSGLETIVAAGKGAPSATHCNGVVAVAAVLR